MEIRSQEDYDRAIQFEAAFGRQFWLGASNFGMGDIWVWNSNGEEVNRNDFWGNGRPSNLGLLNCLEMRSTGMTDASCASSLQSVCEYN